jgi:filamentous hemagglutinin family protein
MPSQRQVDKMTPSGWNWQLRLGICLGIGGAIIVFWGDCAFAQSNIVPDDTLGDESSVVTPTNINGLPSDEIEGGAQRGANLFHSFSEFNVDSGRGAYFANPAGIENIFSRVTGANPSEILGTLGVLGNANLFLINPNGIIFGENARLDVGGSFVGTTADGVRFGDRSFFSASEPDVPPLLTVQPSALFFNQMNPGRIENQSTASAGDNLSGESLSGLRVPDGQSLLLVGGDVAIDGGGLNALGGRVELGGLAAMGNVELNAEGNYLSLSFPEDVTRADVSLTNGARVDVTAGSGGSISVNANNLEISGTSQLLAGIEEGLGSVDSKAGDIAIAATGTVNLTGASSTTQRSSITNSVQPGATGQGGNIRIVVDSLSVTEGAELNTSTSGRGNAGKITINARDAIKFESGQGEGASFASSKAIAQVKSEAKGQGGEIDIQTGNLSVTDGAFLSVSSSGQGNAGSVNIEARGEVKFDGVGLDSFPSGVYSQISSKKGNAGNLAIDANNLIIRNGAQVSAGTLEESTGEGGNLTVNASDSVKVIGESLNGKVFSRLTTRTEGSGNAGNLTINTKNFIIRDGAQVSAGTVFGSTGNGGKLNVNASDSVKVIGESLNGKVFSRLTTRTEGSGNAGNLTINAKNFIIRDGAQVSAGTLGKDSTGDGGNLNVTVLELLEVSGESKSREANSRLTNRTEGEGNAKDFIINTRKLIIQDGGQVSADTFFGSTGLAGTLTVNASDFIKVIGTANDNFPSSLSSKTTSENAAGVLKIITEQLTVEDGAEINAETLGKGGAGDLTITTNRLTLQNQGRLVVSGQGDFSAGNLTINADNITLDNQSSIEANTESGSQGNITLNTDNLLTLRRESQIQTNATGTATGGNITINADDGFIVAVPEENSDITANATQATGGRVFIDATNLYGIEPRERPTPESDITASSELGSEFSGIVEINTLNVDPNRDLVQLPTQPIETEIVQACAPGDTEEQSEFIITGRGGLPPSPEDLLDSDAIEVDWVTRPPQNPNSPAEVSTNSIAPEPAPIIEAQGWIVDENNEIVLIAHTPNNTWQNSPQCQEKAEGRGLQAFEETSKDSPSRGQEAEGGRQKARGKRQKAKGRSQRSERQNYSLLPNKFDPNILIASTEPKSLTAKIPERITVNRFEVKGNTVFDSEELTELLAPYTDKPLSFVELLQARSAITEYYTKRGYITSGAYIPPQRLQNKVVTIQVVEGYLEDIEITGNKRLNSNYVSSRIETATNDSLQREELLAALQLLQQDPLIASLSAELKAGTRPGASVLAVDVREADSLRTPVLLDNRQAPSVGSFRRQLPFNQGNLFGFGDELFLAYSNTEGSDAFDSSYEIPFNARNGTIAIRGGLSSSEVIEEPFDQLNILGDSHYYELSLRQPIVRTPTQEFALGITASRRSSNIASLLDEFDVPPSELSPGADEDGQTRVSALRFFQEWTSRSSNQVIAARSQFNLGLGLFDATVNEDAPDSRFFAWQGQAQWARQLAPDTLFLLRGGIQLATTALLPSEQFGLGGLETLRGYRQDLLLADNAVFASAEIRLPILRLPQIASVLQIAPFFDVGSAWNNGDDRDVADPNTLASVGLGLRLSLFNGFTVRFDWGLPLISVDSESKTWQEKGLYFSVEYRPF